MILTLKELAGHLRVNERTILRMQQSGQITGVKIGGQWRFNSSQIAQMFFPGGASNHPEAVPLTDFTRSHLAVPVSRVLRPGRIILELAATDGLAAINEFCDVVSRHNLALDTQELRRRALERERMLSTGVGQGVAIPHPRDPVANLREPSVIIFGRSSAGIDVNAVDGAPAHLFFLLCSQNTEMHLHMMGQLAHLLQHVSVIEDLKKADGTDGVLQVLMAVERQDFLG